MAGAKNYRSELKPNEIVPFLFGYASALFSANSFDFNVGMAKPFP
jgi:hypothetical protein